MSSRSRRAVVLLSGGLDSATTLAVARAEGFDCYALTVDYGQRHRVELDAARRVALGLGARGHLVIPVDLRRFGGSALTADLAIPTGRDPGTMTDIPPTYVPARNTVFLALALAWAETLGAEDLFIGVNALDYSVDGRALVWVRSPSWARPMAIQDFWALPAGHYETLGADPARLELGWRRVRARLRHPAAHTRCLRVRLEGGQELTISQDHSLFSVDPATARPVTIKGAEIERGMPIVVPLDLSAAAGAWSRDLVRVPDGLLYLVGLRLGEPEGTLSARTEGEGPRWSGDLERSGPSRARGGPRRGSPAAGLVRSVRSAGRARLLGPSSRPRAWRGDKARLPSLFWDLSQRQRRIVVAGLWDGGGGRLSGARARLAPPSRRLVWDAYYCLALDGIFPVVRNRRASRQALSVRDEDLRKFVELYPVRGRSGGGAGPAEPASGDQVTGLWKCPGLWDAVERAELDRAAKAEIYLQGGRADAGPRARRSAFGSVPSLAPLAASPLAFLRVVDIEETRVRDLYDLSVEGCENFVANGILAHNSGYPDCRPEYIEAFERLANLATKAGVEGRSRFRIHAPLIASTKAEIVRRARALGVDLGLTWSCYDPQPGGRPCGVCDACVLRRKGFAEAGIADPLS